MENKSEEVNNLPKMKNNYKKFKKKINDHNDKFGDEKKEEQRRKARARLQRFREKKKNENEDKLKRLVREQVKKYRENLSTEKKEELRKKAREQQKLYRERLSNDKKDQLKRTAREHQKKYREKLSIEKKEQIKRLAREQQKIYRDKLSQERKEQLKRLAREKQKIYRQQLSIEKKERLKRISRETQKIYRDNLIFAQKKQLSRLSREIEKNNLQCSNENHPTTCVSAIEHTVQSKTKEENYILNDQFVVENKWDCLGSNSNIDLPLNNCNFISNNISEHTCDTSTQLADADDQFVIEVLDEKTQCCGCGLILSNEESLIEHIKNIHSIDYEIIRQLRINVNIVQRMMGDKGTTNLMRDKNKISPNGSINMDGKTDPIEPEMIICKSLQGGKTICGQCGLILSSPEHLNCHTKAKHISDVEKMLTQEDEDVHCPICDEICNIFGLHTHINNIHFIKRSVSFECDECGLVYKSDKCLADHYVNLKFKMKTLNFKDFDICEYSHVDKEKESSDNESPEMDKSTYKPVKVYKCKLCSYVHKYSFVLLKHTLKTHLFECPLECPFCDFKTKRRDNFRNHIESMHPDTNTNAQFICEMCGYVTLNKITFKSHIRNHTKKYECEYCDYSTCLSSSINVHRRKHTKQKPYKCDFEDCKYECSQKSSLTTHSFTHYPDKYLQFCDICGFRTVNKYLMNSHLKDHNLGNNLFSCMLCPYSTNIKANLVNHSIVHKDVTQCTMCDFKTKYNLTMRKHMGRKHGTVFKNKWRKNKIIDF